MTSRTPSLANPLDDFDLKEEDLAGMFDDTDESVATELEKAGVKAPKVGEFSGIDETSPIPGGGPLLEKDAKAVFSMLQREDKAQFRLRNNRAQQDLHFDRVRRNIPFSTLIKSEDRSVWKADLPDGITDNGLPVPNKIDDLCTKVVSQVVVDAFLPNPKPDGDSERARGAADLTKKFLRSDGGVNGTDDMGLLRLALTTNMTRSAHYAYGWVDPTAGGWRPLQIKAHPMAEDPKNPLMGPKIDPATKQPVVDPMTGAPIMERCADPVLRYVAEVTEPDPMGVGFGVKKQVFTKNAAEAKRQWQPKHMRRDLFRTQVLTVPRTATVPRAQKLLVLMWETVGEARRRFNVLNEMTQDEIKELCAWRPKKWEMLVPDSVRAKGGDDIEAGSDSSLLFWYMSFCRIGGDYPDGGEVHVNGARGGFMLKRDTLREDVELEDGTLVPVLMRPPIAEFIALQDLADRGDAQGRPPIEAFKDAGQLLGHLYLAIIDCLDKGLNPNIYIPSTSTVTREDIVRRDGTPIDLLVPEDKPIYEESPELPSFTPAIVQQVVQDLNSAAQTNETGNGLDSAYSTSGVAKEVALRTAKTMLSQYWQNAVSGMIQWWQIKTELAQARLTVPQLVKLSGEDAAFKQRWFVGGDLVGISDIALAPGSGTMLTGMEKLNWLAFMAGGNPAKQAWIDPELVAELARASMSDDLGLPPNVHEDRVNREIADWIEGPPAGWEEAFAANQQLTQQFQMAVQKTAQALAAASGLDPATAMQMAQQQVQPPQLTPLSTPFNPRPTDENQKVALIRASKLCRFMDTTDYTRHSPAWRTTLDTAYTQSMQAAGIVTVKQQQEAAAQQQQAAVQQADKQNAAKLQAEKMKIEADADGKALDALEKEKDRAAAAEHDDREIDGNLKQEAMRSASRVAPRATSGAPSASGSK